MVNLVSQFRGAVNVPLYRTPYTVPPPSGFPAGVSTGAVLNRYSDVPCTHSNTWYATTTANLPWTINNGGFNALSYQAPYLMTVNGGWANFRGTNINTYGFNYSGYVANFGFVWTVPNGGTGNVDSWVGLSQVPIGLANRNTSTLSAPNLLSGNSVGWLINNSLAYATGQNTIAVLSAAYPNALFGNANPCYAILVTDQLGHAEIVVIIPGVLSVNNIYALSLQSTGYGNSAFSVPVNFPVYGTQPFKALGLNTTSNVVNYLFGFSNTNNQISRVIWNIPFGTGAPIVNLLDSGLLTFDTNSNLNAQLVKYSASTVMRPMGKRGMFATDIDGSKDYFVSRDGANYWQLNYMPQGSAPKPLYGSSEALYKFIDANGVFWYTGTPTWSGSTIQPYYSLGANFPWMNPVLPGVPPIRVPCFDPCMGEGEPWTKL